MKLHLSLFLCTFFAFFVIPATVFAQIGCPGCNITLPAGLPEDTIYLELMPDGQKGTYYNEQLSFRLPKTTTPVAANDSTVISGLDISNFEIVGISNVPPGLFWEPSQTQFDPDEQTDGCVRFCGTPYVADSFEMVVHLKATVLVFVQETSFKLRLYIAPPASVSDGFTIFDHIGCGSANVSFINNHPSNGAPGYSYTWDFGDSTSYVGEQPPPHLYDTPGQYVVSYHAEIDTAASTLSSVTLLDWSCDDFTNGADIYVLIRDTAGNIIFNSQPDINNAPKPSTFVIPNGIILNNSNYTIHVWDEDSGIEGTDDLCGQLSFNYLSTDTLISGDLELVLTILKPITEIISTDTVIVYPAVPTPILTAPKGLSACEGSDSLALVSSAVNGVQWLLDSQNIPSPFDFVLTPEVSGAYQVRVTLSNGCSAISAPSVVTFHPLPVAPVISTNNNVLFMADSAAVAATTAAQWYLFSAAIPGATDFSYCITQNGNYGLQLTNIATGCSNISYNLATFDPADACTIVSADDIALQNMLHIFPNPARDELFIEWKNSTFNNEITAQLIDVSGREVYAATLQPTHTSGLYNLPTDVLHNGLYLLRLHINGEILVRKVVIQY